MTRYRHTYTVSLPSGPSWAGKARCPCGDTAIPSMSSLVGETFAAGDNCPDAMRARIVVLEDQTERVAAGLDVLVSQAMLAGRESERADIVAWLRDSIPHLLVEDANVYVDLAARICRNAHHPTKD